MGSDDGFSESEIAALVRDAVTRCGAAGDVTVEDGHVSLRGFGPTVRRQLGTLPEHWRSLSADERQRRANELARELVSLRRTSLPAPIRREPKVFTLPSWVTPVALLAAVGAGVWASRGMFEGNGDAAAVARRTPSSASSQDMAAEIEDRGRELRAGQVCEETRTRVMRGGSVSPADVDGWVVELTLLVGPDEPVPSRNSGLSRFVRNEAASARSRLVWPEAPELANLDSPTTRVEVADIRYPDSDPARVRGLTLTFFGRYVTPYFNEETRPAFMRMASALSEHFKATNAALYARCQHSHSHHLGAWFYGPSPADAVASMVVLMGTYSDVPHVRPELFARGGADAGFDRAEALAQVRQKAASLDRVRIARIIGTHGGMITGRGPGATTLSFGFKDGNRASRSSLDLARALGLASER